MGSQPFSYRDAYRGRMPCFATWLSLPDAAKRLYEAGFFRSRAQSSGFRARAARPISREPPPMAPTSAQWLRPLRSCGALILLVVSRIRVATTQCCLELGGDDSRESLIAACDISCQAPDGQPVLDDCGVLRSIIIDQRLVGDGRPAEAVAST